LTFKVSCWTRSQTTIGEDYYLSICTFASQPSHVETMAMQSIHGM